MVLNKLPPKILLIEPDKVLSSSLCNAIERCWFDVEREQNLDKAIKFCRTNLPNLVVISSKVIDRPISSTEEFKVMPVILLVESMKSCEPYIQGKSTNIGVLQKPFATNQLITMVRSLLRKSNPIFQNKVISYNDIKINLSTFKAYRGTKEVHLGPTEFKILQLFMKNHNRVYSREQIIDYVWGVNKPISQRTVDVHINRIRTLMALETDKHQLIRTIRSAGYCLD